MRDLTGLGGAPGAEVERKPTAPGVHAAERSFDLFLLYADADAGFVRGYLVPALNLPPHRLCLVEDFAPGAVMVAEVERAVSASRFTIAVLSPAYLQDRWAMCGELLASHMSIDDVRVIPLRLTDCRLPLRLEARNALDFTDSLRWESETTRLRDLLRTPAPQPVAIACPYPGMRAFSIDEANRFFGREQEIADLVARLDRGEREIYVIGPSGAGKSSLVQAGLLPKLNSGESRLGRSFTVHTVRPDERALTLLPRPPSGGRVLVFVDQLEELFTRMDGPERRNFIAAVYMLRDDPACYLLFALRAELYGALMESALWPGHAFSRLDVAPLRGQALARAIIGPAQQVGVHLEARLCDRLVSDAAAEPGALPLVQEALRQLWDLRRHRLLGLAEYEALGDGSGALHVAIARRADMTMRTLTLSQQVMARRILLRLVSFGEGRPNTRRRQTLAALHAAGDDDERLFHVVYRLADDRLVTIYEGGREGPLVDLSHEALITVWPALCDWITGRRADELRRRWFDGKVEEWIARGRGTASLLDSGEIGEARQWMESDAAREIGYSAELGALVDASERALARAREAQRLASTSCLERGRALLVEGHPMRALPYLLAADPAESPVVRMLFAQAAHSLPVLRLAGHHGEVTSAAFSLDGTKIVTTSRDRTARIWDAASGRSLTLPLAHQGDVHAAAFSPDGSLVVTASQPEQPTFPLRAGRAWTARVWRVATGRGESALEEVRASQAYAVPLGHLKAVLDVKFSPDGSRIVTASEDNTARVWDAATGKPVTPALRHHGSVTTAELSPDGTRVITASNDHTARIWDASTGEPLTAPLQHAGAVTTAAFSPDGTRVVTASRDRTAMIWSASGAPTRMPFEHHGVVYSAAFSPCGTRIVTASGDKMARIWDIATARLITAPLEHLGAVTSAVFSPNGRCVVTASADHSVQVWNASTGRAITPRLEHPDHISAVSFSPDGLHVLTVSKDAARIWKATSGLVGQPLEHGGFVHSASFSPAGTRVVTASSDGSARIWAASSASSIALPLSHRGEVHAAAFSADGTCVVTASEDGTARVWAAFTGVPVSAPMEHRACVHAVAFSPDGTRVITASADNAARVWDVATAKAVTPPLAHRNLVRTVAFHPDGTRVITASWDNTARIWDASSGAQVGPPLSHHGAVHMAAFSRDGTRVLTASSDNCARIWDATQGKPVARPMEHRDVVLAAAFSPDGARAVTASRDNTARIWDAMLGTPVTRPLEHRDFVFAAAFNPDGTRVVTASRDHTAVVWDAVTGEPLTPPIEHRGFVRNAAFSPDGSQLVTVSVDNAAWLWTLAGDMGSSEDWRRRARSCPFTLHGDVLMPNLDEPSDR